MADFLPKLGDIVLLSGHQNAKFAVLNVHEEDRTANLTMIGADRRITNIPWTSLTPFKSKAREDFSRKWTATAT